MITYCDSLDAVLNKNAGVVRSFIKFSEEYINKGKKDFYNQEVFKEVKVGDVIILGKKTNGKLEAKKFNCRSKNEFSHAGIVTKVEKNKIYISANTANRHNKSLIFFFTKSAFDRAYIYHIEKERNF